MSERLLQSVSRREMESMPALLRETVTTPRGGKAHDQKPSLLRVDVPLASVIDSLTIFLKPVSSIGQNKILFETHKPDHQGARKVREFRSCWQAVTYTSFDLTVESGTNRERNHEK